MLLTHDDLLKSGKYFECSNCKKCIKWKKVHYNPLDANRERPLCRRCINHTGLVSTHIEVERTIRKNKSFHYTYLFNRYIKEGMSIKAARERLRLLKRQSKLAHEYAQSQIKDKSFKERFEEMTNAK